MAHYAFLDENNMVIQVIVGRDESDIVDGISDWEKYYSEFTGYKCKRTSYNGNIRKNFAGIRFIYDEEKDAFIPPKPHNSFILNEDDCRWYPPIDCPDDGKDYVWNENILNWEVIENG